MYIGKSKYIVNILHQLHYHGCVKCTCTCLKAHVTTVWQQFCLSIPIGTVTLKDGLSSHEQHCAHYNNI